MEEDEKIHVHLVSVWRESKSFFSIGGKEGMLFLTDKHLIFVRKTIRMKNWWKATVTRQVVTLYNNKNVMITHDGYTEKDLRVVQAIKEGAKKATPKPKPQSNKSKPRSSKKPPGVKYPLRPSSVFLKNKVCELS